MSALENNLKGNSWCRICFEENTEDSIEDQVILDDEPVCIAQMLKEFSSLEQNLIESKQFISTKICSNCINQLVLSYAFYQKLKKADEYIKYSVEYSLIEIEETQDVTEEIPEEIDPEIIEQEENIIEIISEENEDFKTIPIEIESENVFHIIENLNDENHKLNRKRKYSKKSPNIVLTDKVSHMLSKVKKTEKEENENKDLSGTRNPHKSSERSLYITKFVPSETISVTSDFDSDNLLNIAENSKTNKLIVSPIRTVNLEAIKINLENEQDLNELFQDKDDDAFDNEESDLNAAIYVCQYCPQAFSSCHFLKQHMKKNHLCQFCTKGFEKKEDLFLHVKTHTFDCSICNKILSSSSNLRHHMNRIHKVKLPSHATIFSFNTNDDTIKEQ